MDICLNCHWDSVTAEFLYSKLCCLTILIKGFPNTALNCHSCNLTWLFMPHSVHTENNHSCRYNNQPLSPVKLVFSRENNLFFLNHCTDILSSTFCYILIWTSWYSSWLWSLLLISSSRTKPPHTAPVECEHLEEWDNYYQSIFVISTILFSEAGWGRWLLPVIPTIKWSLMTEKLGILLKSLKQDLVRLVPVRWEAHVYSVGEVVFPVVFIETLFRKISNWKMQLFSKRNL